MAFVSRPRQSPPMVCEIGSTPDGEWWGIDSARKQYRVYVYHTDYSQYTGQTILKEEWIKFYDHDEEIKFYTIGDAVRAARKELRVLYRMASKGVPKYLKGSNDEQAIEDAKKEEAG